jgi:ABC-type antimicrobial peptide transport system permease subunit
MAEAEPARNRGGNRLRRAALAVAFGIGGYVIGALLGYALVVNLSGNTHDRDVEAAMTAAFVIGPLAALIAAAIGAMLGGRR